MSANPNEPLPPPGTPFRIGERVAMFPAVIAPRVEGPASVYLDWDEMVIDDVNEEAQSFGFHFVSEPGVRQAQGFENIVRVDDTYRAWRATWEEAYARTGSTQTADAESRTPWLRVLAGHPLHGSSGSNRHPALGHSQPDSERERSVDGGDASYGQWAVDARILAEIGQVLLTQEITVSVRIPKTLAEQAVKAWERSDEGPLADPESPEQRATRHRAGTLALVGLAISEGGRNYSDEVVVDLGARLIGDALNAADGVPSAGPKSADLSVKSWRRG
jgi:hypothetical protein